jgi:hypothetical protein
VSDAPLTPEILLKHGFVHTHERYYELVLHQEINQRHPNEGDVEYFRLYVIVWDQLDQWSWHMADNRDRGWGHGESFRFRKRFYTEAELVNLIRCLQDSAPPAQAPVQFVGERRLSLRKQSDLGES